MSDNVTTFRSTGGQIMLSARIVGGQIALFAGKDRVLISDVEMSQSESMAESGLAEMSVLLMVRLEG